VILAFLDLIIENLKRRLNEEPSDDGASFDAVIERGVEAIASAGKDLFGPEITPQTEIADTTAQEVDPLDFLPVAGVVKTAVKAMRRSKEANTIVRRAFAAASALTKAFKKELTATKYTILLNHTDKAAGSFSDDISAAVHKGLANSKPEEKRAFLLGTKRKVEQLIKKLSDKESTSRIAKTVMLHDLTMSKGIIKAKQELKKIETLINKFPAKKAKDLKKASFNKESHTRRKLMRERLRGRRKMDSSLDTLAKLVKKVKSKKDPPNISPFPSLDRSMKSMKLIRMKRERKLRLEKRKK